MKLSLLRCLTFCQSNALEFPGRGAEQEVILARQSLPPDGAREPRHRLRVITVITLVGRHDAVLQSAGLVTACSVIHCIRSPYCSNQNWSRSNESFTLTLKTVLAAVDCSQRFCRQELCRLRRASKSQIPSRPGWSNVFRLGNESHTGLRPTVVWPGPLITNLAQSWRNDSLDTVWS